LLLDQGISREFPDIEAAIHIQRLKRRIRISLTEAGK
jgi:hypothetical protein